VAGGLLGLAAGLLLGGSVQNLVRRRLRWPLVVVGAFLVRELLVRSPLGDSGAAPAIFAVSLAVLIAWTIWHHAELPGIWLIAGGMSLNLAVVLANGGRMPVVPAASHLGPPQLREQGVWAQYALIRPDTRLSWLGDWIFLPQPLYRLLPQAYSPGDMVAVLGFILVLGLATRPRRSPPARGAITSP
jgi:hypothetical protein